MSDSETKLYTLAEVSKHNTNKSVWLVIHNSIYDVTQFLNEVCFLLFIKKIIQFSLKIKFLKDYNKNWFFDLLLTFFFNIYIFFLKI